VNYDIDVGDNSIYDEMAMGWLTEDRRDEIFDQIIQWPKSRAILAVMLIAQTLGKWDVEATRNVKKHAGILDNLIHIFWHESFDLEMAVRSIPADSWKNIDIALYHLVFCDAEDAWHSYEKLDTRGKAQHIKHLRDIGKLVFLEDKNKPVLKKTFEDYIINRLGLMPDINVEPNNPA